MIGITCTDDFIAAKETLRRGFTLFLRNFADGPRSDDERAQYFTDAIYALNHPEMQLDFYDLLSGKVPYAAYQAALATQFTQAQTKDGASSPEEDASRCARCFLLLRNYLREQGMID
ncbi:MAG: hypothetical protein ACC608_07050 [Anaerofustis sp.]